MSYTETVGIKDLHPLEISIHRLLDQLSIAMVNSIYSTDLSWSIQRLIMELYGIWSRVFNWIHQTTFANLSMRWLSMSWLSMKIVWLHTGRSLIAPNIYHLFCDFRNLIVLRCQ